MILNIVSLLKELEYISVDGTVEGRNSVWTTHDKITMAFAADVDVNKTCRTLWSFQLRFSDF